MTQKRVKVWDPLVRIIHWSLVASFTTAYLTSDEESLWHIYAGYTVVGLVLFRILWGGIGSEHARFKDFIFGPSKVIQYLKGLASGSPQSYIGHNPAGGYMVVLLLTTLLVISFSGLKSYGADRHGPLAANANSSVISSAKAEMEVAQDSETNGEKGEEFWEEIHEASANFMLFLIALHILGVVISSRLHKENLVKAMITGEKNME